MKTHHKLSHIVQAVWIVFIFTAFYLYFFKRGVLDAQITKIADIPLSIRYWVFLLVGALRGLTLIPVTYLIILGVIFLPPIPLFFLTIAGIMISSAIIYYFSELIHLAEFFEEKYSKQIARLKSILVKNEFSIVALWSAMPFLPTDVIGYVCGSLRIPVKKFLLGVLVGEGLTSAIYIFFGKDLVLYILRLF